MIASIRQERNKCPKNCILLTPVPWLAFLCLGIVCTFEMEMEIP